VAPSKPDGKWRFGATYLRLSQTENSDLDVYISVSDKRKIANFGRIFPPISDEKQQQPLP